MYDMSGNVWEWCWDWYNSTVSTGTETDPLGSGSGSRRVGRGGSWVDNAFFAASCIRSRGTPGSGNGYLGFRVVRSSN
ncbi:MAG: formylglycine-generating enzyme family protein [Treponema sp.]